MTASKNLSYFSCCWSAPSNIALVKYWGKKDFQIPLNPSFSFVLEKCQTITAMKASVGNSLEVEYSFAGEKQEKFQQKVFLWLKRLSSDPDYTWLRNYHFHFNSHNTFPHSAGIASSASSFASLALLIESLALFRQHGPSWEKWRDEKFYQKASSLARQGSGSACRSLYSGYCFWGHHQHSILNSSDNEGIQFLTKLPTMFQSLKDSILILSKEEKAVSSSEGHSLMDGHVFRERRIAQANEHFLSLIKTMEAGDWNNFSSIVESEAMTLHALMMASSPSFILMRPETLTAIEIIKRVRREFNLSVTFTLDAGPNLHVIYPESETSRVTEKLWPVLKESLGQIEIIHDQMGHGPRLRDEISND